MSANSCREREEPVGFLDLPLELRLKIFELAIYAERYPPLEYTADHSRVMMAKHKAMRSWFFGDKIYIESDHEVYQSSASKVQAVSHQFKNDVETLVKNKPIVYKLDLAIMQGRMLWPTWTSVPIHTTTVDAVEVKIRVAGPGRLCVRPLRGGDASPPPYLWWFCSMIEHFFAIGIAPLNAESSRTGEKTVRKQMMAAKVLDLDFIEPLIPYEDRSESPVGSVDSEPDVDDQDQDQPATNCIHCQRFCHDTHRGRNQYYQPRFLYIQLVNMFFSLLKVERRYLGEVLYRGIETIRLRLKGELKYELNIAEWLRHWPVASRYYKEHEWQKETYAIRERFGLKNLKRASPHECNAYDQMVSAATREINHGIRMGDKKQTSQ